MSRWLAYLVTPQKLRDKLVDFECRDVLAHAGPWPMAELFMEQNGMLVAKKGVGLRGVGGSTPRSQ